MNVFKFLSPAYRKRRRDILRFRQVKPRRRKLLRNPMAAYWIAHEGMHILRPGSFRLTSIQAPSEL